MESLTSTLIDWKQRTRELGEKFAERAEQKDKEGSFVFENYQDLKENKYFSAGIPEELGGGGLSHREVCEIIRTIAHYCGSTALAFSMHQHLIAAAIWRYKHKGEAGPMLQKVAKEQVVLVSTGARDWLESNGELTKVEGGYLLTGKKHFASQSIAGDIAITSAPYQHPEEGWQVLHFPVPFKAEGVSVLDDWDVLGMRATGSQTIVFNKVFVPDASIVLTRPRNGFHPVFEVIITVAIPIIMSAYVGIAEKAMEIAIEIGKSYARNQKHFPYIIGKMNNSLVSARMQLNAMIELTNNINFKPDPAVSVEMLSMKTNVTHDCIQTVEQAMLSIGGQSFYKKNILERLFRDVHAAEFHPMSMWEQYAFTGERILNR
jgi:alkylation response protein AidB-like acyl-CoA dehydrogenase